jgi:ABC-2 type transport system ATP-binding protein
MCQLQERKHQVIQELSLGYKKRVGIAQAIIHKPKLVILDEPTSGLDPQQMVELRSVIRSLSKEATVLLSSHNLHEISETCDRLMILHKGKLLAQGNQSTLATSLQKDSNTVACIVDTQDFSTKIQNISSILQHSIQHEHAKTLEVSITTSDPVPVLVRKLVEAQINIHQITPASSELEKIFLSLTTV